MVHILGKVLIRSSRREWWKLSTAERTRGNDKKQTWATHLIHDFYIHFLLQYHSTLCALQEYYSESQRSKARAFSFFEVFPFQISLALALPVPMVLLWICPYSFYRLPLYKETAFCSNTALQRREIKAIIEFLLKCSGEETETHPFLS